MTVIHVVMFGFKPEVPQDTIKDVCDDMLALRERCIHPTFNKPYIKSSSGGKDNSPEGHQRGISHVFVVEFDNAADRDYYCFRDPAHLEFVKTIGPLVKDIQVNDYTPGEY